MSKRKKKKGRKRKSKLSEAAAKQARKRHWDHGLQDIPVHPDDLEGFSASFSHSGRRSVEWRCLGCKKKTKTGMVYKRWRARPNSQERCPRCRSTRIQQDNAWCRCLNCEREFWDFPGSDSMCPNPGCQLVTGAKHPGSPEERGGYVEWLNYDEWCLEYPVRR